MKYYEINHEEKKVILTSEAFVKRASKINSKEFMEVNGLRRDFPNYTFEKRFVSGTLNSNKNYTYEKMEEYFDAKFGDEASAMKLEMNRQRKLHAMDRNSYLSVLNWFFEVCPEKKEQYLADKAESKRIHYAKENL